MIRSLIISEAFKLLNETTTGTWDNAELYLFARAKERELVKILKGKYSTGYLDNFPLTSELSVSYITDGEAYALPDGYIRTSGVFTNGKKWATEINFKDLDIYGDGGFNDFKPDQDTPIFWFEEQGIGVCPKKVASPLFEYTLVFLKEPDAWDVSPSTAPLLHLDAHQLLVWGIVSAANKDRSELASAKVYEEKFYSGAKALGLNRKFRDYFGKDQK